MIIFDLSCEHQHPFEGWFESSANYDSQHERGLISCPHCGSTRIRRKRHERARGARYLATRRCESQYTNTNMPAFTGTPFASEVTKAA